MKKIHSLVVTISLLAIMAASAHATTYYVKSNGDDSLDGRSDTTAWRTIAKVNSFRFATGDDVYFKCGGSWRATNDSTWLYVDWPGTSSDHVTVGAYYMKNGNEQIGVNQDGKPVINGGCQYPTTGYPTDVNDALVLVGYKNYVDVENLKVINSYASGVRFSYSDYGTATNIDLDYIRGSGITYTHSDYGKVEGCTAQRVGTGWKYFGDKDWGFAFGGAADANHITVRNSKAHECWTEGIGFYKGSNYGIAEFNVVWAVQKVGLYICESSNCTLRYNMVYGTNQTNFSRVVSGYTGPGIYISHELRTSYPVHTTKVYGNLVARTSEGLRVGCAVDISTFRNSLVYNNTFVDNNKGVFFYGDMIENSSFKNNIIWNPHGNVSLEQYGNGGFSGLSISNNCWYPAPIHKGSNDIVGDPKLNKTSGWDNIVGDKLFISDFGLSKDSPLIDKGVDLGDSYNLAISPSTVWTKNIVTMDQDKHGSSWEIGALAFSNSSVTVTPPFLEIVVSK